MALLLKLTYNISSQNNKNAVRLSDGNLQILDREMFFTRHLRINPSALINLKLSFLLDLGFLLSLRPPASRKN